MELYHSFDVHTGKELFHLPRVFLARYDNKTGEMEISVSPPSLQKRANQTLESLDFISEKGIEGVLAGVETFYINIKEAKKIIQLCTNGEKEKAYTKIREMCMGCRKN